MNQLKNRRSFISLLSLMICGFTMLSCIGSKDYIVESDYSYSGNFTKYKTYTFFNYEKTGRDSLIPDDVIKKAIHYRMSLLGYKEDDNKPNILVGYKLFLKNFNFKGYNQPELEDWLKDKKDYNEVYDPVKYRLLEGTLFIFLVDRKKNQAIWQGYNSGLINPAEIDNERFVKGTIRTIFDKYRIFAAGYIKQS